jgi:hypothetical protein
MAYVTIDTIDGPRKCKVCDYCRAVCCTSQFCSGRCARNYWSRSETQRIHPSQDTNAAPIKTDGAEPTETRK